MGTRECGVSDFEWLTDASTLTRALRSRGCVPCGNDCTVVVGCGTSGLSVALVEDLGRANVVSLDKDPAQIAYMQQLHPSMTFECCDVARQEAVGDGSADLVVDKSTLDCLLCSPDVGAFVGSIFRMLKVGGVYAIASFHDEALLRRCFFGRSAWAWESCEALKRPPREDARLLVLRKAVADSDDVVHGDDEPLEPFMSQDREDKLRSRWSQALSLVEAHGALFADTPEYDIADFTGDLADFRRDTGRPNGPTLAFSEALAFLRAMA